MPNGHITLSAPEGMTYPVNPRLAQYKRVPMLTVGTFYPANLGGRPWKVSAETINAIVANYDPVWQPAVANLTHRRYGYPASGVVVRLYAEGKGDDTVLLADLANIDPWTDFMIQDGQWGITRSVECFDNSLLLVADGQPKPKYRDKFDVYMYGVALLGTDPAAVPGLGPMHHLRVEAGDDSDELTEIAYPAAAAHEADPRCLITFTKQEVPDMPNTSGTQPTEQPGVKPQPTTPAATTSEPKAPESTNPEAAQVQPGAVPPEVEAELKELRAEREESRKFRVGVAIDKRVAALRETGALSAGSEPQYRALAASVYGTGQVTVEATAADGQPAATDHSALDLLDALLASAAKHAGVLAGGPLNVDDTPVIPAAELTATEKEAADDAGVTYAQYAAIKAGKPLPAEDKSNGGDE